MPTRRISHAAVEKGFKITIRPIKAFATAEAVQIIRDALPDKTVSDITSTDVANAVAFYMGQTTDLNDEGLAMVQNLTKYICDNSVSEKDSENS